MSAPVECLLTAEPVLVAVPVVPAGGPAFSHGVPRWTWACTCGTTSAFGESWSDATTAAAWGRARHWQDVTA